MRNAACLLACTMLFFLMVAQAPDAGAQSTVMIRDDSRLEDASGSPLTQAEFIKRMESGEYAVVPLTDDSGETLGYRLVPRDEAADKPAANARPRIRSTEIEEPVSIDLIRHHYLFLPLDVHDGETWHHLLVVLDTGTFVPLILDPALELDDAPRVRVAGLEFSRLPVGRFEPFEMIRDMNRFRDERPDLFGDRRIAGIAGLSLLRNYLVSIDAASSRLVLRPLESERRPLLDAEPIASTEYLSNQDNIWLPATINGVKGFAHYDTGSPRTNVSPRVLESSADGVESLIIGGTDLVEATRGRTGKPTLSAHSKDLGPAYSSVPLDVIAQLGCEGSDRWIMTVDPRDARVYFESRR